MIEIVIPGNPIPLKRHRMSKGVIYNPQSQEIEDTFWVMKRQMPKNILGQIESPLECPIKVHFAFYMPIPASTSLKKKPLLNGTQHRKKPDLSNLIKFYEDAGNVCVWQDDSLIVYLSACKIYDYEPRTVITVEKLSKPAGN